MPFVLNRFVLGGLILLLALPTVGSPWTAQNLRASVDLSTRCVHSQSTDWSLQTVGLDIHKVFTTDTGDIGTLVFQPYLLRVDNLPVASPLFDDDHDWALNWRIANFNYTGLGHGRFNIRFGHFELPFGLEQVIQTNGTLHQVNSPAGLKTDWGASINGSFPNFDYEFAYTLGSGNEWDTDSSGVVVGRVGIPQDRYWWLGMSFLDGEFQVPSGVVDRDRVGLDFGMHLPYRFSLTGEHVVGHEAGGRFRRSFAEVAWHSADEAAHWFLQWREERRPIAGSGRDQQSLSFGLRFEPTPHWSFSFLIGTKFETAFSGHANQLAAQIRYRT